MICLGTEYHLRGGLGWELDLSEPRLEGSGLLNKGQKVMLGKPESKNKTHPGSSHVSSSYANTSCIIKPPLRHNVEGTLRELFKSGDHINRWSWAQQGPAQEEEEVDQLGPQGFQAPRRGNLCAATRHWCALPRGPWNFLFRRTLRIRQAIICLDGKGSSSLKAKGCNEWLLWLADSGYLVTGF